MSGPTRSHESEAEGLEASLKRMVLVEDGSAGPPVAQDKQVILSPEGPVIGIDLGTTNTCCAVMRDNHPIVVPSQRGHNTIPSVVAINTAGEELVGHAARAQMELNPERTVYGAKRMVGRPFDSPVVRQVRDRFHYKIVEGPDRQAAVQINGRVMSLEEVSAKLLASVRDTAQDFLGQPVRRAVITVPAYYNENQRHAVRRAGELAGLYVERILNEPTAAALAYGYHRDQQRTILVYDLGGGTFDATVMQLRGDLFEVIATGGDTFLGGVDFDSQLMDHIVLEFQLNLGKLPKMDRVAFLRVLQGAEFAKCNLSEKEQVEVRLPFIGLVDGKPVNLEVPVTREQIEHLVRPLVMRTLDVCDAVLAQRSMKPEDVDDILLVGGQTRMPLVRQAIRDHFCKEPLKNIHPDESVAQGAALLGHSLDQEVSVELVDVLPITIGAGVPGGRMRRLITAGTALPTSRTYGFYTYQDGQIEMNIPVFQGDSTRVDDNEYLGTVEIKGIRPALAGNRMIEVTFILDSESILSVVARDRDGSPLQSVRLITGDSTEALRDKTGSGIATATLVPSDSPAKGPGPAVGPHADDQVIPASFKSTRVVTQGLISDAVLDPVSARPPVRPANAGPIQAEDPFASQAVNPATASARPGLWGWLKGLFGR